MRTAVRTKRIIPVPLRSTGLRSTGLRSTGRRRILLISTPVAATAGRRIRHVRVSGCRQVAPVLLLQIARIFAELRRFLFIGRLREDHGLVGPVLGERDSVGFIGLAPARRAAALALSEQSSRQDEPWENRNYFARKRTNQNFSQHHSTPLSVIVLVKVTVETPLISAVWDVHLDAQRRPFLSAFAPIFYIRLTGLAASWGKLQNAVGGQFLDEVLRVLYGLFRGHIKRGVYSCSATYIKVEQSRIARP